MMQFCQLHGLELSTSFLRECARSNEWLQFLLQAQLYGHQPAQVSSVHWPGSAARGDPSVEPQQLLAFASLRILIPLGCGSPSFTATFVNLI